jgi:hypothetical protein
MQTATLSREALAYQKAGAHHAPERGRRLSTVFWPRGRGAWAGLVRRLLLFQVAHQPPRRRTSLRSSPTPQRFTGQRDLPYPLPVPKGGSPLVIDMLLCSRQHSLGGRETSTLGQPIPVQSTCWKCSGSGRCPHCLGTGKSGYAGVGKPGDQPCQACSGSGLCSTCRGTGNSGP